MSGLLARHLVRRDGAGIGPLGHHRASRRRPGTGEGGPGPEEQGSRAGPAAARAPPALLPEGPDRQRRPEGEPTGRLRGEAGEGRRDRRAQYELGYWCEQNRLSDLAKVHYEQALASDPDLDLAHQKLGHTKVEGTWLTRDDLSAAQGLVKYKGRWVTAEEKTQAGGCREARARAGIVAAADPHPATGDRSTGRADRRREAESQLMAIRDPDAVVPLVRVFGQDEPRVASSLALVLSTIGGPEATAGPRSSGCWTSPTPRSGRSPSTT